MQPLISVLVPIYNAEKYLPRCLESILQQTYTNLEIVLVDDGSTDRSSTICDEYGNNDSRIKTIHRKNMGVASARNLALHEMTGEYLMFVDSDDYISSDAVQTLYERIAIDGTKAAVGKFAFAYEDGGDNVDGCDWMQDCIVSGQDILAQMQSDDRVSHGLWAKLYKSEVFSGIECPILTMGEDLWIFPALMERCDKISIVNHVIYYYFQRSNSLVHSFNAASVRDHLEATLYVSKYFLTNEFYNSACKWFGLSIGIAWPLRNRAEVARQFAEYFNKNEEKQLAVGWNLKTRIQYVSIYSQLLYDIIRIGNQFVRMLGLKE